MHRRLIVLTATLLAGVISLATSNHAAYAVTEGEAVNSETTQSKTVTVKKGDYLAKLARENDTTYLRLYYANEDIDNPDLIYPGDELRVPGPSEDLTPRSLPGSAAPVTPQQSPQPAAASVTPQASASSAPVATTPTGSSVWDRLAACESGGNWSINTGNGYYGGLQFSQSSWQSAGGSGSPHQASRSEQIRRAEILLDRQGWGAWPACSAKLGLR